MRKCVVCGFAIFLFLATPFFVIAEEDKIYGVGEVIVFPRLNITGVAETLNLSDVRTLFFCTWRIDRDTGELAMPMINEFCPNFESGYTVQEGQKYVRWYTRIDVATIRYNWTVYDWQLLGVEKFAEFQKEYRISPPPPSNTFVNSISQSIIQTFKSFLCSWFNIFC